RHPPQIGPTRGRPRIGVLGHAGRRRDRIDRDDVAQLVRDRRAGVISVDRHPGVAHDGLHPRLATLHGHRVVLKLNVTVSTNGVGMPLSTSGRYCHCLSASVEAWSSSLCRERRIFTDSTHPSVLTTASRMTTPVSWAAAATSGYVGSTRFSRAGAVIWP